VSVPNLVVSGSDIRRSPVEIGLSKILTIGSGFWSLGSSGRH
jgi:hypothetical protein